MTEGLAARVSRIVSGSLNSLVGAIENMAPEVVMEEAIREIESAIEEVRAELGRVTASHHLSTSRLQQEHDRHATLGTHIELAVKEGRDDLAEAAIAKQIDIEAQIPVLEATLSDYGRKEKELETYILALQAKRREMLEELSMFRASQQVSATASNARVGNDIEPKVAQASRAFERVSGNLPSGKVDPRLGELEELARKNRISERLAAMKAGSGK